MLYTLYISTCLKHANRCWQLTWTLEFAKMAFNDFFLQVDKILRIIILRIILAITLL